MSDYSLAAQIQYVTSRVEHYERMVYDYCQDEQALGMYMSILASLQILEHEQRIEDDGR